MSPPNPGGTIWPVSRSNSKPSNSTMSRPRAFQETRSPASTVSKRSRLITGTSGRLSPAVPCLRKPGDTSNLARFPRSVVTIKKADRSPRTTSGNDSMARTLSCDALRPAVRPGISKRVGPRIRLKSSPRAVGARRLRPTPNRSAKDPPPGKSGDSGHVSLSHPDAEIRAAPGAGAPPFLSILLHRRPHLLKFQHAECRFLAIRQEIFLEEPGASGEYT